MCQVLEVTRSRYYQWLSSTPGKRLLKRALVWEKIKEIHALYPFLGLNPIHALVSKEIFCSRKLVHRLMKEKEIRSTRKKRYHHTTDSNHALAVSENLLERDFSTSSPNEVWVGDITYIATEEGFHYAAIVKDLYTKEVVGYATSSKINTDLVEKALLMGISRERPRKGLIFHSDRGIQYCSKRYQNLLKLYGIRGSMSSKGSPYDNAVAENFFSNFKSELVYQKKLKSRREVDMWIFWYIEGFYNTIRPHSSLKYLSPKEFKQQSKIV